MDRALAIAILCLRVFLFFLACLSLLILYILHPIYVCIPSSLEWAFNAALMIPPIMLLVIERTTTPKYLEVDTSERAVIA
jgi:hypothetical protein